MYVCVCSHACKLPTSRVRTCSPGAILLLVLTVISLPSLTHQQLGSQEWFNRAGLGAVGREGEGSPNRAVLKVHMCVGLLQLLLRGCSTHVQCVDCRPDDLLVAMVKTESIALQFGQHSRHPLLLLLLLHSSHTSPTLGQDGVDQLYCDCLIQVIYGGDWVCRGMEGGGAWERCVTIM